MMPRANVHTKPNLVQRFRTKGTKNASDNGTASKIDTAKAFTFAMSRCSAYAQDSASMEVSGNATMKPANTGFFPANCEVPAMTMDDMRIFSQNSMFDSFALNRDSF